MCATSTFHARNRIFKRSAFKLTRNRIITLLFWTKRFSTCF